MNNPKAIAKSPRRRLKKDNEVVTSAEKKGAYPDLGRFLRIDWRGVVDLGVNNYDLGRSCTNSIRFPSGSRMYAVLWPQARVTG